MLELIERLQALAAADDVEGITQLLETWPQRDEQWEGFVTNRIYAATSSKQQKQRLKTVRAEWKRAVRNGEVEVSPMPTNPVELSQLKWKILPPREGILSRLERSYAAVSAQINQVATDHAVLAKQATALLGFIKRENKRIEQGQRAYHKFRLASDSENTEPDFVAFIAPIEHRYFAPFEPAADQHIDALQEFTKHKLPIELVHLYQIFGALDGDFKGGEFGLRIDSAQALSAAFKDSDSIFYGRSLGLMDMIQWSWGNGRDEFKPEHGYAQADIDLFNQWLCIGVFCDGAYQSFGYIIETSPDRFGVFTWHQDYPLETPNLEQINEYGLFELLNKVLHAYENAYRDAQLAATNPDDIDLSFDVSVITSLLND